jgi:hypothetical protein
LVAGVLTTGAGSPAPNSFFTQAKKPPPVAGAAAATAAAATGAGAATTGSGLGTAIGAGVSGRMPLITGSCLALVFSRRVMPTSSSGSSIIE